MSDRKLHLLTKDDCICDGCGRHILTTDLDVDKPLVTHDADYYWRQSIERRCSPPKNDKPGPTVDLSKGRT